jgi:ARG/rhodanese/phosphatase superfamily protein
VFCVEPGRWVDSSSKFDTHASVMAQPSVRKEAMVAKDQQKVWNEVGRTRAGLANKAAPPSASGGTGGLNNMAVISPGLADTTSYAKVRENAAVQKEVESISEPMQKSFESVIKQLRDQNAVGVVVAVKGRIIWADLFASNALLGKYWPKLLQSYAAEALTVTGEHGEATMKEAQAFAQNWTTTHEVIESEPGLYRQTEMTGSRFKAFQLTSLLPKQNFDVHLSKMSD